MRFLPLAIATSLSLTGCTATGMSDNESCQEIAKNINVINGLISDAGDATEAAAVLTEVAKSLDNVSKNTTGEKSTWTQELSASAADASLSIMSQNSEALAASLEKLISGVAFEADYCPAN